jgi:hypothetical protein
MKQHLHKYLLVTLGGTKIIRDEEGKKRLVRGDGYPVFKCIVAGCPHYIALDLARGRECACWDCNMPMVIDQRSIKHKRPHHRECGQNKFRKMRRMA